MTAVGNAGGTGTLTAADGQITGSTPRSPRLRRAGRLPRPSTACSRPTPTSSPATPVGRCSTPRAKSSASTRPVPPAARPTHTPSRSTARSRSRRQIQSGHETSTVRIGPAAFLGVEVASVPSYAGYGDSCRGGFAATPGAQVSGVVSGAAAASAGLQAGDVITSLNGQAVSSPDDVSAALVGANPGDQVTIGWTSQDGSQHERPSRSEPARSPDGRCDPQHEAKARRVRRGPAHSPASADNAMYGLRPGPCRPDS